MFRAVVYILAAITFALFSVACCSLSQIFMLTVYIVRLTDLLANCARRVGLTNHKLNDSISGAKVLTSRLNGRKPCSTEDVVPSEDC